MGSVGWGYPKSFLVGKKEVSHREAIAVPNWSYIEITETTSETGDTLFQPTCEKHIFGMSL